METERTAQTRDFTRISWGDEFVIDAPIEGIAGTITGQGNLVAGDHIVLCVKCRVDEVENYPGTPDLWQASISIEQPVSVDDAIEGGALRAVKNLVAHWGDALQQIDVYQRIEQLFIADRVTQVASRNRFESRLVEEWQRMRREQTPLSILLCALDGMEAYQDAHGKEAVDQCLLEIAQTMQGCARRAYDVVARYEEYKFAMLLPNTSAEGVDYMVERIRKTVLALPCCDVAKQPAIALRFAVATQVPNPEREAQGLTKAALESLG
jgi:diguanylate cyclase (GGDEF)-like protein